MSRHIVICLCLAADLVCIGPASTLAAPPHAGTTSGGRIQLQQSALARLVRAVGSLDDTQQSELALVTLDALTASYDEVLRDASQETLSSAKRRQKLARWQQGTRLLIDQIGNARLRLSEGAPLHFQVDAQDQVFIIVDGAPIAVSGPNPAADRRLEREIVERFCAFNACDMLDDPAPAIDEPPGTGEGAWVFDQRGQPAFETHDGVRCEFDSMHEREAKAGSCRTIASEIRLLRDALAQSRERGHGIDWAHLENTTPASATDLTLVLNSSGAYLRIDAPLLTRLAAGDWQHLMRQMRNAAPHARLTLTIRDADRLLQAAADRPRMPVK